MNRGTGSPAYIQQLFFTSATFSGPPKSSMSSSRVLGGRSSARSSSFSSSSFFIFWASSTESWLVRQLSWLSDLTDEQGKTPYSLTSKKLSQGNRSLSCHAGTCLPVAGVLGGLTEAVKVGLVEHSPEANKALWIESGSILFLLFFFFFSFPFFGSFLLSHGSRRRKKINKKILICSNSLWNALIYIQAPLVSSPSSSSDSSLNGLKSSSSSAELTDLKLSSLSQSLSDSSDWLSSELVPDRPPCFRGRFFCCFLTSEPGEAERNKNDAKAQLDLHEPSFCWAEF